MFSSHIYDTNMIMFLSHIYKININIFFKNNVDNLF